MAKPARQLNHSPDENPYTPGHVWQPNSPAGQGDPSQFANRAPSRTQLQKLEGQGQGDGQPAGNLALAPQPAAEPPKPVYDEPTGVNPSSPKPNLTAIKGGRQAQEPRAGQVAEAGAGIPSRNDLSTAEAVAGSVPAAGGSQEASDQNAVHHTYHKGAPWRGRFSLRGRLTRRRAIFGGGMIGTIVSLIFFLTFSSGPAQFVQIAKLMDQFHFASQEDAGDGRMGKMYRFLRSGGDAGETRLGYLGSSMKDNMLADLEKVGLKPHYVGVAKVYDGFEIDRDNPNSPYKGMSDEKLTAALKDEGVNVKEIKFDGNKASIKVSGYINQRKSLKFLVDKMGTSRIPSALRVRVLARYGLVTWHPLKKLDIRLNATAAERLQKFKDWQKEREARLRTGTSPPAEVNGKTGQHENPDANGNERTSPLTPDEQTAAADAPKDPDKSSKVLESLKEGKTASIAGGVAAAAGVACGLKAVNDNIPAIRYAQVLKPLMRMGFDAVTVGNQIMTGQDVDADTISFLAKSFTDPNSSWSDAKSILSEEGKPGGTDMTSGIKDVVAGTPIAWLSWTDANVMNGLCSTVGQAATGVISVTLGIVTGNTVSTLSGLVIGATLAPKAIDFASHLLAGQAVNVLAQGAEWGNDINYGSRLGANAMAMVFGGVPLEPAQEAQLKSEQFAVAQANFHSSSLFHRLFSPTDPYSAMGKLVAGSSPSFSQNLAKMGSIFFNFGHLFSTIPNIFTHRVAAAGLPYDYGFKAFGFSQADLNSSSVNDPFANAQAAAAILNGPDAKKYRAKALACFGVDIRQVPDPNDASKQLWDAIPSDSQPNPYDPNSPQDCAKPDGWDQASLDNWLKIRFFIFDTGIMEGYACYNGDEQSCANDGFDNTGSTATAPATTGTSNSVPSGTAQQLASQILASSNITFTTGLAKQAMIDASQGKPSAIEARCNAGANAVLSPELLTVLLQIAASHKIGIGYLTNGCHTSGSLHYQGKAADINSVDGRTVTGGTADRPFMHEVTGILPNGSEMGQLTCSATPINPINQVQLVTDSCDHIHIGVP